MARVADFGVTARAWDSMFRLFPMVPLLVRSYAESLPRMFPTLAKELTVIV